MDEVWFRWQESQKYSVSNWFSFKIQQKILFNYSFNYLLMTYNPEIRGLPVVLKTNPDKVTLFSIPLHP